MMNFLTQLLAVDVPDNTTLESWEFSFRGLSLWWFLLLLLITLTGIAGVGFLYLLEKGTLGNGPLGAIKRIVLIGLRCAMILLLLFFILRPILLAEFVGQRPQGVVLLIDNSQSMQLRDRRLNDRDKARVAIAAGLLPMDTKLSDSMPDLPADLPKNPSRIDLVKSVLQHKDRNNTELKLVDGLQKFGPLRPYFFGLDVYGIRENKDKKSLVEQIVAGCTGDEPRTALHDSIMKILQTKDGDLPSAIVLVTDGQDNASKFTLQEAVAECARAKIPLHIYGVGSTEAGLLQLTEVNAPDTLFAEDMVAIPMHWRARGFKDAKGKVTVKVTLGGKEVPLDKNEREIDLQIGEDLRHVVNFVVPKESDSREAQDLVVEMEYKAGGEAPSVMKRSVRVVDLKIRVLYVEHSPRWEFKFLQPALLRDRRIKADFILVNGDPRIAVSEDRFSSPTPYLPHFPKSRKEFLDAKYNLIILGDVASSYFTREQQEWIREFVQNRGGLIAMAGRQHMPSTYENTPIAEVLPIEFKKEKFGIDSDVRTREYQPALTEAGQRAGWLALADSPTENLEVWQKKLLGFHWYYPITKLKPAATALVVNPRAQLGEQPMPIMANHYFGKGEVLWLGTDETWRWRWNYQDKYFVRLWGQIVYQFGLPSLLGDGARRVEMALEHSQAVVGTQSKIYVRLLDKDFNPRVEEQMNAELYHLDAKAGEDRKTVLSLNPVPGRPGQYSVLVPHDRPGRFELEVRNPETSKFAFRVDLPPHHEKEEAGLAESSLREAAKDTGGHFYREEDLHELVGNLKLGTKEFTLRQEVLLWNPLAILLFLGLITMEWIVRKFSDLS